MRLEIQANPAVEARRPSNKAAGAEVANAVMEFLLPKMDICIPCLGLSVQKIIALSTLLSSDHE